VRPNELTFDRPIGLEASMPPEEQGRARDNVRLLVTTADGHLHSQFRDLPDFLRPGDLLVANDSATLAASLPARSTQIGDFTLNLSTQYGPRLWLTEPRWSPDRPGPLPFHEGDLIQVGEVGAKLIAPYPGLSALWFAQFRDTLRETMEKYGSPIRYKYVNASYPLEAYQTIFGTRPGSAEMPSAARPFSPAVLESLEQRGVHIATITLHTGVSSQELESEDLEEAILYPEPFWVSKEAALAVNKAYAAGGRVIAIGTTVARALESAWESGRLRPTSGFTRLFIHPSRGIQAIQGLLTGFHDPASTHLALLSTIAGASFVREAYQEAIDHRYLWHEFGDSHLILMK
jgi:S-adenosylmethionine:tRNA ribosyltransferase-isomerase